MAKKKTKKKVKKAVKKTVKKAAKKKVKKATKKATKKSAAKVVTGLWSSSEVSTLKKTYSNMSTRKVAEKLGRTTKAVEIKAFKMGLHKSKKYLREVANRLRRAYS